jgi:hypothetical protein
MILSLGTEPVDMARAFPPTLVQQGRLERFFSPIEPHTTTRRGRSCESCHNDPLALGLGRGTLRLETEVETGGVFVFEPEAEPARDGLPSDSWTGFLQTPRPGSATRSDARPFNAEEQHRILRVGACLTCHEPTGEETEGIYRNFEDSLARVTPQCRVPRPPVRDDTAPSAKLTDRRNPTLDE